jgi:hypothetical protein
VLKTASDRIARADALASVAGLDAQAATVQLGVMGPTVHPAVMGTIVPLAAPEQVRKTIYLAHKLLSSCSRHSIRSLAKRSLSSRDHRHHSIGPKELSVSYSFAQELIPFVDVLCLNNLSVLA